MNKKLLPQGDLLRQLLISSNITNSNINSLLREKGVFLGNNQKDNSVPLLMKSIISPKDFNELYESQKSKEENSKYRTSSIKCNLDFNFQDILKDNIDLQKLINDRHTYKPNYELDYCPNFVFEDNETAVIEYKIRRTNYLNNWNNCITFHNGSVTLKKTTNNGIQISVQQNATSRETIEVNNVILNDLKQKLKNNNIINSPKDIITVNFNHFNNENRINFLYSFYNDFNIYLKRTSITDIDIYIDENIESPEDIKKFIDQIENLKLKGKELQNHILIKTTKYHSKLIFGTINYKYKMNYNGIEGNALINIGFPDYVKTKDENSEFQISIEFVFNKQNKRIAVENSIRKKLLELLELKKVESYEKFKSNDEG